ncbi:MAG TPA: penicillin acylase family protein [Rhodospirillales bacterium]|jgi:penicillin amidase|nr:penicillin acylase family protein [Rhodospirillales bacterium]
MKRFLIFSVSALISLVAMAGVGGWLWLQSTLPTTDGSIEVGVLELPVEVMRDDNGIPHIFAKSSRDAYFALGYIHAQDRFWQMETMRRYGAGRLSEIIGSLTLASDKWMRTLGLYRLAEQKVAQMPPKTREALNLYAAGVNARIKKSQSLPWGVPTPEIGVLRYAPEPWRPADSLVWGKIMSSHLGRNWRDEILRARLARKLSPKQVGELWPVYPDDAPRTTEKAVALMRGMDLNKLAALSPVPAGLPQGASNAWVIANKKTLNRGPILANDPHLRFSAPILWYLARIQAPDLEVTGATVPGVPFTILGHNGKIAWGMTSTQSDITDLFVEQVDETGKKYKTPEGWQEFETRTETIAVKDAAPVTLTVRESRHGPIISDLLDDSRAAAGKGAVMALSAAYLQSDDLTADALYRLNRAGNWESFKAALKDFQGPQSNFLFADTKGDIGFMAAGLAPKRRHGWGLVPSPGWDGLTDWDGYVPFDELPSIFNPASGRIVNSNNNITPKDYPHFLSLDWAPGYRAKRILELVENKDQSVHATAKLQQDHVSAMALHLLPMMLDIEPADVSGGKALAMLKKWKGKMSRGRPEPLIFSTWLYELNRAVYADELGELFQDYLTLRPQFIVSVLNKRQSWCDNINTAETEDCHGRIRLALKTALDRLKDSYGEDLNAWRWGEVHKAWFAHPLLSKIPVLKRFGDLEIPVDGGNYTVNRGASHVNNPERPFKDIHGPGYRAVYDLEDLRRSRFIIATGQSGNPVSNHYKDLLNEWRDGRYRRMGQTRAAMKTLGDVLMLTPSAQKR